MLHRTRVEVGRELPEVVRSVQSIDIDNDQLTTMTDDAVEFARLIVSEEATNTQKWRAAQDLDWRLRQATGVAKAKYVAAFVKMLLDAEEPVVLFGWHHEVYDIWQDKLEAYRPAMYTGIESPNKKHESAQAFLDGRTNLLIMSLRAGAGLDGLQARCRTAVFGELDWAPGVHDQCIGRLHRDGQDGSVLAYYLVAESGSDPVVAEVLQLKRSQSVPINTPDAPRSVIQAPDTSQRMKTLAREFLAARGTPEPDPVLPLDGERHLSVVRDDAF